MEYVGGKSLRNKINRGPIKIEDALDIAIQVAEGMEQAHKKGIIHRDIKSANIMVTDTGQAKIMDFGLAKVKGGTQLTREGITLGTVAYMSPEQARGEDVDNRSDIWSLGIVMYEMLSGLMPFIGEREASILYSVVHEEHKPLKALKPDIPTEIQQIINRALKKRPESRYQSSAEMLKDLKEYQDSLKAAEDGVFNLRSFLRLIRRPVVTIPVVIVVLAISLAAVWFLNRQAKIRWAKEEALPEIERLTEGNYFILDYAVPYKLAERAERYIPNDPKLSELFSKCSVSINIKTEPPDTEIYIKDYKSPDSEWQYLGLSPIEGIRVPIEFSRWMMKKAGYETVMAACPTFYLDFTRKNPFVPNGIIRVLDKKGDIPEGMVRVLGTETNLGKLDDFFIDVYEVTNRQYKEFINSEGYMNRDCWKHDFIKDGRILTWEEAMVEFVDQTGRPGPAAWQAGDYPEGQDDYPVSGISWYEAAAYAEFVGKSLPTGYHWDIARGGYTHLSQISSSSILVPMSNYKGEGPAPVGSHQGMTSYGAYDMAGNVREWCWNEAQKGKIIRGGAWNDNIYMFGDWSQAPPFDRSPKNGFRCALYLDHGKIPESAFKLVTFSETRDLYKENPVPDSIFEVYIEQFSYDKTDLNERVESRDESSEDYIQEKITFDAAYGDERVITYLFLPKNTLPPYQAVIYFPGSGSQYKDSSKDLDSYMEFETYLSFILKNGRAVLYPVYKGTFERRHEIPARETHKYVEYLIQVVKDFKRCIDYLATRPDIDSKKLAYYGLSWGGRLGATIPAIEGRLNASVLLVGGFGRPGRPEVNPINYVGRVKTPTLMLNGRYDMIFPYETDVKPMFDLMGIPDEHKQLKLYETDHFVPKNEFIKETLAWLDRYLGPVNR
jgi:dienelactone hydrolase